MKHRPELVAFALAAVVVAAAALLLLAGDAVPSWFPIVALAAVTGGAGLAVPGSTGGGEATSSGEPTTADGWTLADLATWIDTELVPKIERAFARAHVHPSNGGGVAPPSPVPAAPASAADAQGTTAPPPPPPTNVVYGDPLSSVVPQSGPAGPTAPAGGGSVL